ncbi:MAG: hypothetical protein PHR26_04155 [Candidatus ainarchaeum sp.]|nr:hypothetical protein [Candidatus ainarchaeum sp.]
MKKNKTKNYKKKIDYNLVVGIILSIIVLGVLINSLINLVDYYKEKKEWDNNNFAHYIPDTVDPIERINYEIYYCYTSKYLREIDKEYCKKYYINYQNTNKNE